MQGVKASLCQHLDWEESLGWHSNSELAGKASQAGGLPLCVMQREHTYADTSGVVEEGYFPTTTENFIKPH